MRITTTPMSVNDQRGQPVLYQLVKRLNVVGHPGDDHARQVARVEAQRQRLQVREQLQAQVLEGALAHPANQVGLRVGHDRVDHGRNQEHDHDHVQGVDVVAADSLVDGDLGQRGRSQRGGGSQDQGREHGQHPPLVRGQQLGQST
jgi:hypothetical protein